MASRLLDIGDDVDVEEVGGAADGYPKAADAPVVCRRLGAAALRSFEALGSSSAGSNGTTHIPYESPQAEASAATSGGGVVAWVPVVTTRAFVASHGPRGSGSRDEMGSSSATNLPPVGFSPDLMKPTAQDGIQRDFMVGVHGRSLCWEGALIGVHGRSVRAWAHQ